MSPFGSPFKGHPPVPELDESNKMDDAIRFRHMNPKSLTSGKYTEPADIKKRPGFVNIGSEIPVAVNSYAVLSYPTKKVYQYDVSRIHELRRHSPLSGCLL